MGMNACLPLVHITCRSQGSGLAALLCTLLRPPRRTAEAEFSLVPPSTTELSSMSLMTELWLTRRFGGGGVEKPDPVPGRPA